MTNNVIRTGGAGMKDWHAATKDLKIGAYIPGERVETRHDGGSHERGPSNDVVERQDPDFTREDFERDLGRATRRRSS